MLSCVRRELSAAADRLNETVGSREVHSLSFLPPYRIPPDYFEIPVTLLNVFNLRTFAVCNSGAFALSGGAL